jgi:GDP-D-mannose dehydratase
MVSRANPSKALHKLGWKASLKMPGVVELMTQEYMNTR